jgi:hypothetical protein
LQTSIITVTRVIDSVKAAEYFDPKLYLFAGETRCDRRTSRPPK